MNAHNTTAFILLAAGKSQRMSIPKGLLAYNNSYWILEQINRIAASSIGELYIGLGYHHQAYLKAIPFFAQAVSDFVAYKNIQIRIVLNPNPQLGSFSSLQSILQEVPKGKNLLISAVDIPLIGAEELQKIINCQNSIVLPNYQGKNGHPIKLQAEFWNSLLGLDPHDAGSRLDLAIKKANPQHITQIAVNDPNLLLNLNTMEQWKAFTEPLH